MPKGPFGGPRPLAKTDLAVYIKIENDKGAFTAGDSFDVEDKNRLDSHKQRFLDKFIYKDVRYIDTKEARNLLGGASIGESLLFRFPGGFPFSNRVIDNMVRHSDDWFGIQLDGDNFVVIVV